MNRLAVGGRIDRTKPVRFSFDGKQYTGFKGDTIASALLANGVLMVGRSWKYHRPRGIIGDGTEEPNAIFQVEQGAHTIPNVRATQAQIYNGMVVKSIHGWPSIKFDVLSVFSWFSRFLPAGFYYKTFMWPGKFWHIYEYFIRKVSGLGHSPKALDPSHYDKTHANCDILVVGSGPSGLMAALTAARAGARLILVDEQDEFGGRLLSSSNTIEGQNASQWVGDIIAELSAMADVTLLKRSTVFGYHDANFLTINQQCHDHISVNERQGAREKVWHMRAKQVILATGAHERPIVFANNDRPGVMLASAVSSYVNRYAVKLASKVVIYTNNDGAYQTAIDCHQMGALVTVVDVRKDVNGALPAKVRQAGITVLSAHAVTQVVGSGCVKAVKVSNLNADSTAVSSQQRVIECQLVATSGGWNPAIHLLAQSGGKVSWNDDKHCFVPDKIVQEQVSVGAANAVFDLNDCLADGQAGANACLQKLGFNYDAGAAPASSALPQQAMQAMWCTPNGTKPWRGAKQFVDYQNDVSVADIYLAAREGFESIEHVKRYTALGFGTDQGKTGNITGMAILSQALGQPIESTGTTTFRPNYTPVSFGAIAGPEVGGTLFDPIRKTAMHAWHEAHGALFENVGQWHRAWYYPKTINGRLETLDEAVQRECLATRNSVGMMDASTLGKIEIVGKDASEFLNRLYTNAWKKLGINCARYGFMLGEDGMIMDDGVTVRLDEHRYFMHTTTGGAASVLSWMERWLQTEWPDLEVYLTSVTDHWATTAVVGPNSRHVVSAVVEGVDFSPEAFPFMTSRTGTIDGLPVRINRISFSGELAYEVNVCANQGCHVWERLYQAGQEYNITPYGTETMHVLRAEKGYMIVGQDTDGSMTPIDMGQSWAVSKTKDFLGRRSLSRSDCVRENRKEFVGLLTKDPNYVLPEGGQIVLNPGNEVPLPMMGHVTSSYYSAALERSIALAVVKGGFNRQGETVYVTGNHDEFVPAEVTSTVFYDPEGERQHV